MGSRRNASTGLPTHYAMEKSRAMDSRRAGPLRGMLERMAPIAFPGCDARAWVDVLIGFTSFSVNALENTTDADLTQSFHEVGLFQVPAGPRTGPAPNPDPEAHDNAYRKLADGPLVRAMLQRSASTRHNAWKPDHDPPRDADDLKALEEQTAVGLANLRSDYESVRAKCEHEAPGSAGAAGAWTPWAAFLMFTAMSRGPTGAFNRLRPYLHELASIPEAARIQRFAQRVDEDVRAHRNGIGGTTGKGGSAYGIVRSLQKLYSGRGAAERGGGSVAFFAPCVLDPALEQRIAQAAYGDGVSAVVDAVTETASGVATIASDVITDGSVGQRLVLLAMVLLAVTTTAFAASSWSTA